MVQYLSTKTFSFCLIALLAVFAACKKEQGPAFDQSPDERINATLAKYQTLLSGSQYGWKAVVQPAGGGAYSFYLKFNDANRVVMYSDFDSSTAVTPGESSYRLKSLQQPSLIFDTYSYLHLLSDPNENTTTIQSNVNGLRGGTLGQGLQSDFEFAFDTATTDSISLTGRQHGTKAYFVKATQQEAAAYENRQLAAPLLQLQNINKILYYFKRLTLGGKQYDVSINDNTKTISFTWIDNNGAVRIFNTTFYYTTTGIVFTTPFNDGSQTITGFTGITWNDAANSFTLSANNTTGTLVGVNSPIVVDREAPIRWWNAALNAGNTYWISVDGFHVNGVDDAYNLKSLRSGTSSYFYMLYWPQYGATYDLFAPVFLNEAKTELELFYGTAPRTLTINADGRVVFRELGTLGAQYPATGPAALSRTQFYNAGGYYFVQTSATSYDMISAADARIWITWEM
ncbi:MAG TPA: DUF4302 domain-containing protein [Flavisolibacter sp.]|jgi:hypothetical protein|nr:DUF4302 domain-containing protein [Flavisolibacter sp.]